VYSGRLPSRSDAAIKHRIRRNIHPQLKELWRTHPALVNHHQWVSRQQLEQTSDDLGILLTDISGKDFGSRVHPQLKLYAELDILVLRPETPGAVISHSGDIDNQLKTLFDALRRPAEPSEPSSWSPDEDEQPLHCLLDDDKLITRVNVEMDRLLKLPDDPKDVNLTIRVTVKGFMATWGNIGLTS
jgi:hypothetical protein